MRRRIWGGDAGFCGLGDEGMTAVVGGVGEGAQLFHELLPFPFGEIGVGVVGAFVAVYELWGGLGGEEIVVNLRKVQLCLIDCEMYIPGVPCQILRVSGRAFLLVVN